MDLINTRNRERESSDNKPCGFVERIQIAESFRMHRFFYQDGEHEDFKGKVWWKYYGNFSPHFVHR